MNLPSIGQTVRIRLRDGAQEYYQSRLVEMADRNLFIEVPLHPSGKGALDAATTPHLWVEYNGQDGALRRFHTRVLDVVDMPMPLWRLEMPQPEGIIREQRREFVRVSADLDIRLTVPLESGPQQVTVHAYDISGGGLAVWLPRTVIVHPGMTVEAQFTLPKPEFPVTARCSVIRVGDRNERGMALASMKFEDLKESIRQRIIQYTFWRQLRTR
ncbi:PilZ domain-containing protein [Alicyclobacillus sp.]|uniref:flagellar brake protein n=1 Tax=Alicyclobacillus sp. TaxID=61169 RepID=UPI0025BAD296|nr:PilZ domain-containing protein [Alicyclobacillus sp.]MCL6515588.1 PilZ domain-containing protein [Alicyclobacillus sp.]